jgi:hypothetical protein
MPLPLTVLSVSLLLNLNNGHLASRSGLSTNTQHEKGPRKLLAAATSPFVASLDRGDHGDCTSPNGVIETSPLLCSIPQPSS